VTRNELVKCVSLKHQTSVEESAMYLDSFLSLIASSLNDGDEVKLANFGTFQVRTRAGGVRRNPRTGEKVEVGERKTVGFKPSASFKGLLNETSL